MRLSGKKIVTFINNDDNKYIRVVHLFAIIKSGWLVCHGRLRSVIKAWSNAVRSLTMCHSDLPK